MCQEWRNGWLATGSTISPGPTSALNGPFPGSIIAALPLHAWNRLSRPVGDSHDAEVVCRSLAEQDFLLLETLAEHIAQLILNDFGAAKVRVRIVKPGILPDVAQVGIEIERTRE